jgi:hypothetical protein
MPDMSAEHIYGLLCAAFTPLLTPIMVFTAVKHMGIRKCAWHLGQVATAQGSAMPRWKPLQWQPQWASWWRCGVSHLIRSDLLLPVVPLPLLNPPGPGSAAHSSITLLCVIITLPIKQIIA